MVAKCNFVVQNCKERAETTLRRLYSSREEDLRYAMIDKKWGIMLLRVGLSTYTCRYTPLMYIYIPLVSRLKMGGSLVGTQIISVRWYLAPSIEPPYCHELISWNDESLNLFCTSFLMQK